MGGTVVTSGAEISLDSDCDLCGGQALAPVGENIVFARGKRRGETRDAAAHVSARFDARLRAGNLFSEDFHGCLMPGQDG